jgi:4-diphosphocytidyl-2-C-methyl-D-erythritol kinase
MKASGLILEAPCKVNLHLRVKERRVDGYHELESIFLALAFGDTLRLKALEKPGPIVLSREYRIPGGAETPPLPPERDLIYRAAVLFREKTGFDKALRIRLKKRVPLGGGLGGGSSDAAAVLRGLDALAGTALSREALASMAGTLGSDVPFFLAPGAAWVSGRGEQVRPLKVPEKLRVVLVNPGFPSDTARAFRRLDRARGGAAGWTGPGGKDPDPEALMAALGESPGSWPYGNDFLPLFLKGGTRAEAYRRIIGDLKALGADFTGLSGAGSTCFGIFTDGGAAERAVRILSEGWNFIELTFPLASSGSGVLK